MVTSVELRGPFEYSFWLSIIYMALLIVALAALGFIAYKLYKQFKAGSTNADNKQVVYSPSDKLKNKYINRIQDVLTRYNNGQIDKRTGYQELSAHIRGFVHEATGINVENYTASQIKVMNIPYLDALMEEYYVPEFAEEERALDKRLDQSCNTAMGVIKQWN